MSRLNEIKDNVEFADRHRDRIEPWEYVEDVKYLLNEVERLKNDLKELSRYTHPDYPFKGETLISEVHALIILSLKEPNTE